MRENRAEIRGEITPIDSRDGKITEFAWVRSKNYTYFAKNKPRFVNRCKIPPYSKHHLTKRENAYRLAHTPHVTRR